MRALTCQLCANCCDKLSRLDLRVRPVCKWQSSALPVLTYSNVRSAPVLDDYGFRLSLTRLPSHFWCLPKGQLVPGQRTARKKRPHPRMGPDNRLSRSKVGQRAREEDMRSAIEPGSREEDTIQIRCRDTEDRGRRIRCSSQRQCEYARWEMNAQLTSLHASHAHTAGICPAREQKDMAPLEGRARPYGMRGKPRKEGTQRKQGREAPAVSGRYKPEQRASQLGKGNASHARGAGEAKFAFKFSAGPDQGLKALIKVPVKV